ncbi:MAG: LPD23 domain-containing protein [Burkholderiaceae bacterium]
MLAEKPSIGTFTAARPEPDPSSLGEIYDAAVESAHDVGNWGSMKLLEEEAYDRRIDAIKAATGIVLRNPYRIPPNVRAGHFGELQENLRDPHVDFQSELERLAEQFPDQIDAIRPGRSPRDEAAARANRTEKKFQDVFARGPAGWRWGAAFAGGFAGSLSDAGNVSTMMLGPTGRVAAGAASVVWMGIKQAVANAAVEAVQQPAIQHWRARAGLEHGLGTALMDIGMAGAFGFVADAGVRSAFRGSQRFRSRVPELDAAGNIIRWRRPDEALDDAARRLGRTSTVRKAAEGDRKALDRLARETGADADPAVRGARQAAEIDADVARPTPPLIDRGDGLSSLVQALRAAEDPIEPPPMRPDPVPEATGRRLADDAPAPPARFRMDAKPVTMREVAAAELVTDAGTFQFKAGGDVEGATGRLAGVRQWDPLAAGRIIVFERVDGALVIADGHQRLSLAKRLEGDGHEPISLQAVVFREADGWTPSDVRALAAKKNLQEGSGTVIDAARVIRERPGILDSSVPLGTEAMRQARALAKLSDEALAAVINGEIAPNHAAVIGDLVRDRSQHAGLVRRLIEGEPANVREARHMVADLMQVGARAEAHRTLLGADARALIPARAKVLDRAVRLFREDARIFSLISREARRIEQAGNRLAVDANADRALTGEAVVALIEDLAVRDGPVSELLDEAARALEAGTKVKAAAQDFVDAVRGVIERDGLAGLMPHEQPLRGARGIDAPGGPEAQAQVAALERELGARIDQALEVAAERAIDKWAAWSKANGRQLPDLNPLARAEAVKLIRGGTAVADAVDRAVVEAAAAAREAEAPRPPRDPLEEIRAEEAEAVVDTWRFVQEMRRARRPQRLVNFFVERGGIKDEGGDLRAMIGRPRDRPGLISSRGMALDDAAHLAWEEGFLTGRERPEINDLLSAIDDDLRGTMVVREADREALEAFLAAEEMEADLGRLGLEDVRTEAELRQRLGRGDAGGAREGREGLGGDQARAGGPEDEAPLDEPPFDLAALGDLPTRDRFDMAIALGEVAENSDAVVRAAIDKLDEVRGLIPGGVTVGILKRIEPIPGSRHVNAVFAGADGGEFELRGPWSHLRSKRASWLPGRRTLVFFKYGDDADAAASVAEVSQSLVGEVLHELVHVYRALGLIDDRTWALLVRHAEDLGVLDLRFADFAQQTGRPWMSDPDDPDTLRVIYDRNYSTYQDAASAIEEEGPAHLIEMIFHGAVSPSKVAPIAHLLEGIFAGDGGAVIGRHLAANENAPMFAMAGQRARSADLVRLEAAQAMEGAGRTAEEIWQTTGWFRGADGAWRFEISDRDAKLRTRAEKLAKGQIASKAIEGRADKILDHPLLWEAYPELRRVRVRLEHDRRLGRRGVVLENPREIRVRAGSAKQARLVLLHELQHLIQVREGFARGGSPGFMTRWVRKALGDLDQAAAHAVERLEAYEATIAPFDAGSTQRAALIDELGGLLAERESLEQASARLLYFRLAGEVEARNVERRSLLRRPERLAQPPEATEDVPRVEQIALRERTGPQLTDDWEEALWEELSQRAHRIETAAERQGQARAPRADRSPVEIEADRLATAFRTFEEKLAAEGMSAAEIADAMTRHFGVEVDPQDLARRMVWWRIEDVLKADRRAGRLPRKPAEARPGKSVGFGLSEDERAMARDMVGAGQSVVEVAQALSDRAGRYVSVAAVSQTVEAEGVSRALGPTEVAVAAPDLAGLTARQMAERLSERLGRMVTEKAVYRARDRAKQKGIALPEISGAQPRHGRSPTWLNAGKFEWTPEALAMLTREDLASMKAADLADLLSQTFGGRLTANAVRLKRSKLARELDEANRATELKDTVESCKL